MSHFEFIQEKEQEQAALKEKLERLEGRKALLDSHTQEHKLLSQTIKEVQEKLCYLELEIDQFVRDNSKVL